jgi:ATP-binding cassette, subfamily B, bacterial PglK
MIDSYRKLYDILSRGERRKLYLLIAMMLVNGVLEMTGVAAILPFLAVLADPGIIETNANLAWAYDLFGFTDHRTFLMVLGGVVFLIVIVSLGFKVLTIYATTRFSAMRGYSLSTQMMSNYLRQPYAWFLQRHSADLGRTVLFEVEKVVQGSLLPAVKLLTQIFAVVFLVALLVAVNPVASLLVASLVGGSYALIFLFVRKKLAHYGAIRWHANKGRFDIASESMGGIKDVKLMGLEEAYLARFRRPAKAIAQAGAMATLIGELPRHILEAVAFGGMLLLILFLLSTGESTLTDIAPVLGLYAFAGLRMFPALQSIYLQLTHLRTQKTALDALYADLRETRRSRQAGHPTRDAQVMHLHESLELVDVHYTYPKAERPALSGLNLTVPAYAKVGIVGGTGAGKTTVVDLILGLLEPDAGEVRVDGTPLTTANLRSWQNAVGYVPQHIFLLDASIRANIAFGKDPEEIDQAAIERAARVAELHDFVVGELSEGYDTVVGERGVRLSGGQRQRIGIARALYHDPDILILDEATSALDNLTERAVMDAVRNLGGEKTVVMIAHRLTTVRGCDVIFMMEQGRVVASGSFDELVDKSQKFRAMVAGGQG